MTQYACLHVTANPYYYKISISYCYSTPCYVVIKLNCLIHCLLLCRYLNEEGYEGGFNRPDLDTIFESMSQNFSGWAHSFAPSAIAENDPAAVAYFESSLLRMKPEIALSVAKTVFLSDFRWVLPQVAVPCTIIQSRKDPIAPTSIAFYMKEKLGAPSQVKILETQGHFPMLTACPLLLEVLKDSLYCL